jgi:hypothetical protein
VGFFVHDRRSAMNLQTSIVLLWEISFVAVGNLVRDLDIPWEVSTILLVIQLQQLAQSKNPTVDAALRFVDWWL